jgi:lactoylglutathione lyase
VELGYVILYVEDLERSVEFYRDVIGLPYKFTDAGYAEFGTDGTRFALYERRRAEWLTGQAVTPGPAAEIVLVVEDVDACADRLAARGVTVLSGPADRPWGHRTVHVADPDGFVVEFAQEIPRRRGRISGGSGGDGSGAASGGDEPR